MAVCFFCDETILIEGRIRRNEVCPGCGGDLHCCVSCRFYDPGAHNNCREPSADWVSDGEKANFCDYYELNTRPAKAGEGSDKAKAALDALFRKGE